MANPDDAAFADQDLARALLAWPEAFQVALDRHSVERLGLRKFIQLAWPTVEGGNAYKTNWHIDAICEHLEAVSSGELKRLIIAVPPRSMKPVHEDELVVLETRGRVPLSEVRAGDRILTHKGRFRPVTAVHDNGVLPTVRLNTWVGRSVRMAPDHPVLTTDGWKACGGLAKGDTVVVVAPTEPHGLTGNAVISVVPDEPGRCLCLTVEEDHSFTAGDVAVHNSVSVAVMWPAWDWIANPSRRFLFSSYAHNLSIRDSAKCRRVIQSPWYQQRWGDRFKITSDQNTKIKFDNDHSGYRLSTSVGGALTGEGGSFCIVDDPLNSRDADSALKRENMTSWWHESMSTRLNDPANGAYVIIQQRLHEQDLIGDIIKTHGLVQDGGEYTYLCLAAEYEPDHPHRWFRDPRTEVGQLLWPSHVPRDVLETLKKSMGAYSAAGQLQQRPSPREGGMFKRLWFPVMKTPVPIDLTYARGWDLAASEKKVVSSDPDYTATCKIGFSRSTRRWYVLDVRRWRENPAEIERIIKQVAQEDEALGQYVKISIPQDPGQAGKSQGQALIAMMSGFDVRLESQSGSKMQRVLALASQASSGNVSLVSDETWNEDFHLEMMGFPTAAHDDIVDAAASAFNRLTGGSTGLIDYYEQQAEEIERKRRAGAEELERTGGTLPGLIVVDDETTDLARALTRTGKYAP